MAYETWVPAFRLYDRWGAELGELTDVRAAEWDQEVGGEDTLTLECGQEVPKGTRVVWCDWEGSWHEHVAGEPEATRDDGLPSWRVACPVSMCDLDLYHVEDKRPSGSASLAVAVPLEGTPWTVGSTEGATALPAAVSLYRCSALDALKELAERLGCELYASYEAGDAGVTARRVNMVAEQGPGDRGRRFEYGRDLVSVTRTVSSDHVYTALYGYGRGEEVGDGNGRRITFGEVNGGVDWVGDEQARLEWGVPDAAGGKAHAFGHVTFDDVEDKAELLRLTKARLEQVKRPRVSYGCDVTGASEAGLDATAVSLGEEVAIVDASFSPTLRATGRVTRCEWDLMDRASSRVEVGDLVRGMADKLSSLGSSLSSLSSQSAAWQAASGGAADFVRLVLSEVNDLCEQSASYVVKTPELGVMVADVPLDEQTGAPKSVPSSGVHCVNLRAGVLRVADEYSGGQWQWRTAATGSGIVADAITAGTLNADLIRAGVIRDAAGLNFWDLTTGELSMTAVAASGTPIARCESEAATVDKVAACEGFELAEGATVLVRWAYGNTASSPTLNVNGTGAKPIKLYGKTISGNTYYAWVAGATSLVYYADGAWNVSDSAALARANGAVSESRNLDKSLDVEGVFNRLTANGALKGLYMTDGDLYINGTYIKAGTIDADLLKAGIIADQAGRNFWNLETGEFSVSSFPAGTYYATCSTAAATAAKVAACEGFELKDGATILCYFANGNTASNATLNVNGTGAKPIYVYGAQIVAGSVTGITGNATTMLYYKDGRWNIADSAALWRAYQASKKASDLDESLTQQEIFNRLTNDGVTQGIYLSDGKVYINADYIKAGTLVARRLMNANGTFGLSPTELSSAGGIFGLEMLTQPSKSTGTATAQGWAAIPGYNVSTSALEGYAMLCRHATHMVVKDGSSGSLALGYDGTRVVEGTKTIGVSYPRLFLQPGYVGLQLAADRNVYMDSSGCGVYDGDNLRQARVTSDGTYLWDGKVMRGFQANSTGLMGYVNSSTYFNFNASGLYMRAGGRFCRVNMQGQVTSGPLASATSEPDGPEASSDDRGEPDAAEPLTL